jgi:hypothetical protein
LNLTNWMRVLDDRQQERIVAQLAAYPQLRLLVSPRLIEFWMQGASLPQAPLVRYLTTDFAQESTVEEVVIWARHAAPTEAHAGLSNAPAE